MIIDFSQIKEESVMNFKGGKGELCTRNYIDGKCKIMKSCLRPGASSGLHTHEGNCEIVYIISGTATFYYDGENQRADSGDPRQRRDQYVRHPHGAVHCQPRGLL